MLMHTLIWGMAQYSLGLRSGLPTAEELGAGALATTAGCELGGEAALSTAAFTPPACCSVRRYATIVVRKQMCK